MRADAERIRNQQQQSIDAQRAALLLEVAGHQQRIDVAPLDLSGGPENDRQAQAAWDRVTAFDRSQLEGKQRRLDAMATVAAVPENAWWIDYFSLGFSLFFEALIVLGLWSIGVEVDEIKADQFRSPQSSRSGDNIVDFGTARDARDETETVRRLKNAGASYREIEDQTGISKSRAQRLYASK